MVDVAVTEEAPASRPRLATGAVGIVVAVQVAVLTALSGRYGFHRDELYFLAAGDRPAWGYVDQPPITPLLAKLSTAIFGETPMGLRVIATLIGAAMVVVVALVARELGSGKAGQVFAAAACALSSFVLVVSHLLATTTLDMLLWALIGLFALKLLRMGDGRWWLAIGAAVGVGMANKWLVLLLVLALGVALLVTGPRQVLRTWWLAAGIGVGLVVAAPILVWQAAHDWPLLTVASGISADDGAENRLLFVPMQIVYVSPVLVPVWIAGIVRLWRDPAVRWARALALSYPILCVILLILGGKPYYSVPLLVLLTAAGAEPALRWITRHRAIATGLAVVGVAINAIVGLPVLPVSALGPAMAMNAEQGEQVGWHELTATVAGVWDDIPAADQDRAVILTSNYGQAGAIEEYRGDFGLPAPFSGHMSFADWGPPADDLTGPVVLVGEIDLATVGDLFDGCEQVTENDNGMDLENQEQGTNVALCTGPARPWSQLWPDVRHYY
ncbi:ArnT family glycosyltransferase [Actinophytocola sp.]|uniref:ArnT family glycosyltransferase n=1 Tax=Actinophytocola sp. TaxID=1872138 RepID=UPI002ED7F5F6